MVMVSEREQLACLVQQWNENRLDLFHLSYPTEELEVEGVMRFYFQDGGEKVVTKCVRVSSTATTRAVVDALSEKFLPDLKMLSNDTFSLWEVRENGEERKLGDEEKPLVVQLQWHKDDTEGRFLLKKDKAAPVTMMVCLCVPSNFHFDFIIESTRNRPEKLSIRQKEGQRAKEKAPKRVCTCKWGTRRSAIAR
ncbi:hypothetical protein CAEBREN_21911 [Caenorhabditis brenneri]|uniref:Ras-associating domain-containing protein n=1 Tax=Caenorhabditis brenneri TaxID=135651 RepID=G0MNJ3_CAEBE|nr:hypothetical protein CAEBREN_21911 [Caenorhabditis brenneri]